MRRTRTMCKRLGALALALLLCVGTLPASAAGEEGETITISSPHDLVTLAENCALDDWSRGKTVVLTADVDLGAVPFRPIPIFGGRFLGNGHTVSGLDLTEKGTRTGLFRVIEAGGSVEDLTVRGNAAPGGSAASVGLLCGENAGRLSNCAAEGLVSGETDVGGLVGVNTGWVENCRSEAVVTGQKNTGGVAGRSTGTLSGCVARGEVNTRDKGTSLLEAAFATGGVVGANEGAVKGCANHATVGYPHTGYNVGGVAGTHKGTISDCANDGEIMGRKGVGGIVGRFMPETDVVYGQDPVEILNTALAGLSGLLTTLAGQVSGVMGDALDDVDGIADNVEAIRQSAGSGREQGAADAREAVDRVYASMQSINASADGLNGDFQTLTADLEKGLDDFSDHLDDFREGVNDLASAADEGLSDGFGQLNRTSRSLEMELDNIQNALERISNNLGKFLTFRDEANAILRGDDRPLEKLDSLRTAVKKLEGIDFSYDLRTIGGNLDDIGQDLSDLAEELDDIYSETSKEARDAWERADEAADAMTEDGKTIRDAVRNFSDSTSDRLSAVNRDVDDIEDTVKTWAERADAVGTGTMDDIDSRLEAISGQVDAMTDGGRRANQDIRNTTDAIIRQLDRVREAAKGAAAVPEYSLEDRSDEDWTDGLVLSSQNRGKVSGDSNVGGVAGIVSVQLSDDPEEDWDWDGEDRALLSAVTAVIRAAVRSCENEAPVTAQNEGAGGIVGRADMGAVLDCVNTGDVTVESGPYCGGVAGFTKGVVRRSYALCALEGVDSVGGVAGAGEEITGCRTMVTIQATGEKTGTIAGWDEETLSENYTVREGLGAVDGIDYAGKAQGLDYAEFALLEGLPDIFLHFALTFRAEGETVKVLPFSYGGSVSAGDIPAPPAREGYSAAWERFSTAGLRRSRVVEAVYTPYRSTIASDGSRPVLLAQGSFGPDAGVALKPWTPEAVPAGKVLVGAWEYEITGLEGPETRLPLRVLAEEGGKKAAALLWENGQQTQVEAVRDGGYLVFEGPLRGRVAVIAPAPIPRPLLLGGAGVLAVGLVLLVVRRKKRRKAQKAAAQGQQESAPAGKQ